MKPNFTPVQQQAVAHRSGVLMVQAAAGSGKTTVLSERCASLIADGPAPADVSELLVMTFTREAAGQMRGGIARALRSRAVGQAADRRLWQQAALVDQAQICTFDSFCAWLVRSCFAQSGQDPGFCIMDAVESRLLFRDCFCRTLRTWLLRNDADAIAFADIFDHYANSSISDMEQLLKPLESAMINLPDPEAWAQAALQRPGGMAQAIAYYFPQLQALVEPLAMAVENAVYEADSKKIMAKALQEACAAVTYAVRTIRADQPKTWDVASEKLSSVTFPNEHWKLTASCNDHPQAFEFRCGTYTLMKAEFKRLVGKISPLSSSRLLNDEKEILQVTGILLKFRQACRQEFARAKVASGNLDFSDIAHLALAALAPAGPDQPPNALRALLQQRFKHIMVDEYQDINPVQQELLRRLSPLMLQPSEAAERPAGAAGSFFGVGDVHQSIYAFRGSEPAIMDRQCAAMGGLPMPDNFRTLPPLIDALNGIFAVIFAPARGALSAPSPSPSVPLLRAGRPGASESIPHVLTGSPVTLHVITPARAAHNPQNGEVSETSPADFADQPSTGEPDPSNADQDDSPADLDRTQREACLIAAEIKKLMGRHRMIGGEGGAGRAIQFSDIVVLMRSVRSTAAMLVRTLQDSGIPAFAELRTGFFDSQEVLETMELLNVLDNPAQDIPIAAVLLGLFGGFSHDDLTRIRAAFPDRHAVPFYQAVEQYARQPGADPTAAGAEPGLAVRLNAMLQQLDHWRDRVHTLGVAAGMAHIFQETNLFSRVLAKPYGRRRVANLKLLHQKAIQFGGFHAQGLARFNAFVQNVRDDIQIDFGEAPLGDINAVRVMSVHASKGLEFPIVFLAGLGRKFKLQNQGDKLLADQYNGIGLKLYDPATQDFRATIGHQIIQEQTRDRELAEEARILYVAMTRARDHLVLVGHGTVEQCENWAKFHTPESRNKTPMALDWLGPIFSSAAGAGSPMNGRLHFITHEAPTIRLPAPAASGYSDSTNSAVPLNRMLAFEPLPAAPAPSAGAAAAFALKLAAQPYPHAALTKIPAICTVSQLKSRLPENAVDSDDPTAQIAQLMRIDPEARPANEPEISLSEPQNAEGPVGATVGSITHRVLEILDFSIAPTPQAVREQISAMVKTGRFTEADADAVAHDQIAWFLTTPTGRRAAKAAGNNGRLYRELTFFWTQSPGETVSVSGPTFHGAPAGDAAGNPPTAPADEVLVRGAIDALVVDDEGILVIDYKTDAATNIAPRLAMYQFQVRMYAHGVRKILNLPPSKPVLGMLVFLRTKSCHSVSLEP